jgi:methyl-accepting chemotaxis protein
MSIETEVRRLSDYALTNSRPTRLASATIQAVDQVGGATADEIERTADQVMRGATEVATKLHELAAAIKEHSEIASEHVANFCDKATSVFESVLELQQRLRVNECAVVVKQANDEILELPMFMKKGVADFDNDSR